jgi:hypothetical protein
MMLPSDSHRPGTEVDYKYRAKVAIILIVGCTALWIGVACLALHAL